MDQRSGKWPPSWPLHGMIEADHSNQVEHRLTNLEDKASGHETRLSRLEKIILAVIAALNILAHDKLPEWAKGVSILLKASMR